MRAMEDMDIHRVVTYMCTRPSPLADLLETLVDCPGFAVHVHPGEDDHCGVSASDMRPLVSLLHNAGKVNKGCVHRTILTITQYLPRFLWRLCDAATLPT